MALRAQRHTARFETASVVAHLIERYREILAGERGA
jgi:hypothetical protein